MSRLNRLFVLFCLSCLCRVASAVPTAAEIEAARHAFDFLHGDWTVVNRRLSHPADPASAWESFAATNEVHALPAGIGNYDAFRPQDWRPGFVGMSLRVFDPATARWTIYWLSNRDGGLDPATGQLQPPVIGAFHDGVGRFEGSDVLDGKPIRVRFTWTVQDARHAHWEQAFSFDAGAHWLTNWTMDFTRRAPAAQPAP